MELVVHSLLNYSPEVKRIHENLMRQSCIVNLTLYLCNSRTSELLTTPSLPRKYPPRPRWRELAQLFSSLLSRMCGREERCSGLIHSFPHKKSEQLDCFLTVMRSDAQLYVNTRQSQPCGFLRTWKVLHGLVTWLANQRMRTVYM